MLRIFVSYASQDAGIAKKLAEDLQNVGHEVYIDAGRLQMGEDVLSFMNESIRNANVIIVVFSAASARAKWQILETGASLWKEVEQGACRVIVLRLDNTELPPLLSPKAFGNIADSAYEETFRRLVAELVPAESSTSLFNKALTVNSPNPFWRVRAEYFEQGMPRLLAEAFSPPDSAKMALLEEMMPCFLEGSRGTGKTMLLMSLRARVLAFRPSAPRGISSVFGFYLKLDRGAFCNAGINAANEGDFDSVDKRLLRQLAETFAQELYLSLVESLFSELSFLVVNGKLTISPVEQSAFIQEVLGCIHGPSVYSTKSIGEFLDHCAEIHRKIGEFVRRKFIYEEDGVSVPVASLDMECLGRIIAVVRKAFPELASAQFTVLLDEYENLFTFQQVVVNTVVKSGPPSFSIKIARKVGTQRRSQTSLGQDLQDIHDYNQIPLVYPVEDFSEFKKYVALLDSIVRNLLSSQSMPERSLSELLPADDDLEVDPTRLEGEVVNLLKTSHEAFNRLPAALRNEKMTYYREAAIYRLVYGKRGVRAEKRYSGFEQLALISSGVIRWFQEILGMAYHLEYGLEAPRESIVLSPGNQSRAVHIVSDYNLASLGRNIETHGERLRYFLLDVGDCLRHKLLHHGSEPEAGRVSVVNPEQLQTEGFSELATLLRVAEREGILQTFGARLGMRPKHGEPQPVEFGIARIYAPVLQFSPRFRWRTPFLCSELRGLLDPQSRQSTKSKLMRKVIKGKKQDGQGEIPYGGERSDD